MSGAGEEPPTPVRVKRQRFARAEGEDDPDDARFGGWQSRGDYHELKKQKLREQTTSKVEAGGPRSRVFAGVVAHINGHTVPSRKELWELIAQHGGQFEQYPGPTVTHVIVSELPDSKVQEWRQQPAKNRKPHVLPSWVMASIEKGRLEPWVPHLVPRLRDTSQRSVFDVARRVAPGTAPAPAAPAAAAAAAAAAPVPRQQHADSDAHAGAHCTRTDPDFVRKYFKRSRLHHIGASRGRYQKYVSDHCRQQYSQHAAVAGDSRVIMHIDMDCFFASVAMLSRPALRERPFVVCFASAGDRPVGEISSASYPARQFGIRAGMMAREALRKCPHLLAAPYEFDKYESVSDEIYKIFARAVGFESGRIEAVSCDEAYLDLTGLELPAIDESNTQASPSLSQPSWDMDRKAWGSAWAAKIRSEVATATGCPVSAGLGPNKLLARLATAEAKPDGQKVLLDPAEVDDHLRSLAVSKLPGLGWKGQRKLKEELDIASETTIAAVRAWLPESELRSELSRVLGPALGTSVFDMLHGRDDRGLETQHVRKSYSAEVNWGVRFNNDEGDLVAKFVEEVGGYVSEQLRQLGLRAAGITIKAKRRKKNAPPPGKMLGHGPCDDFAKSTSLGVPTADRVTIGREAMRLYDALEIPPGELRGFGIMMTRLTSDDRATGTRSMTTYFQRVQDAGPAASATAQASESARSEAGCDAEVDRDRPDRERGDILDSSDEEGDVARPSFSQTLDPETLSQQSAELRSDSQGYDEEVGEWRDVGTASVDSAVDVAAQQASHSNIPDGQAAAVPSQARRNSSPRRGAFTDRDLNPHLSQIDPEVMASLGPDWSSICLAELEDSQRPSASPNSARHPDSSESSVGAAAAGAAAAPQPRLQRRARPQVRVNSSPTPRAGGVRVSSSGASPARAQSNRGRSIRSEGIAGRRRRPAQQTLVGMRANSEKWNQMQEWASRDPAIRDVLRGMSKEEQLAMYGDLRASQEARSASIVMDTGDRINEEQTADGITPARRVQSDDEDGNSPAQHSGVTMTQQDAKLARRLQLEEERGARRAVRREHTEPRPAAAEDSRNAEDTRSAPLPTVTATVRQVVGDTADARPVAEAGECRSRRLLAQEDEAENLQEACSRLVAGQMAPCEGTLDALSLGFWQMLEDGQLDAADAWLKFLRRLVAGSEWRAPASQEWVRGFNVLLERCQLLVHDKLGAFLKVNEIA